MSRTHRKNAARTLATKTGVTYQQALTIIDEAIGYDDVSQVNESEEVAFQRALKAITVIEKMGFEVDIYEPEPGPCLMPSGVVRAPNTFAVGAPYPVGSDTDSLAEVTLDFSLNPHWLIVGTLGLGRTTLMRGLVTQAVESGWTTIIGDFRDELIYGISTHRDSLHESDYASLAAQESVTLHVATEDMAGTLKALLASRANGTPERSYDPVLIVVDEISMLAFTDINQTRAPHCEEVMGLLRELHRAGRSINVHLVVGAVTDHSPHGVEETPILNGSDERIVANRNPYTESLSGWKGWGQTLSVVSLVRDPENHGVVLSDDGKEIQFRPYWFERHPKV